MFNTEPYTSRPLIYNLINLGQRLVSPLTPLPHGLYLLVPSFCFIVSSAFLSIFLPSFQLYLLLLHFDLRCLARKAAGQFPIDFNHAQWAGLVTGDQFARVVWLVCAASNLTAIELAVHHTFFLFVFFLLYILFPHRSLQAIYFIVPVKLEALSLAFFYTIE